MADADLHSTGKRGGDRNSAQAKAARAARQPALVTEIAERRQWLDQNFFDYVRRLRVQYGDAAVDRALAAWREQRDAVAIAPTKERRGAKHYRPRGA